MKKEYYCRQKFLFETSCDTIDLALYYDEEPDLLQNYTEKVNLFDIENDIRRFINVSELDSCIDDEDDFEELLSKMRHVDTIYILDSRIKTDNPILKAIQSKVLKAYILYFEKNGKKCKIIESE